MNNKNNSKKKGNTDLPNWVWLILPLILWLVPYIAVSINKPLYKKIMFSEFGVFENLTLVFLLIAVIMCAKVVMLSSKFSKPKFQIQYLKYWIILLGIASFYFMGEEASWGMHFFGWEMPDSIQDVVPNKQHETNFHNIFDMRVRIFTNFIPHFALSASAILAGFAFPLVRKFMKINFNSDTLRYWLFPTIVCVPAAFLGAFITKPKGIFKLLADGDTLPNVYYTHNAESKEAFLAYFIMLYVISIYTRMKADIK